MTKTYSKSTRTITLREKVGSTIGSGEVFLIVTTGPGHEPQRSFLENEDGTERIQVGPGMLQRAVRIITEQAATEEDA